MPLLGQPRAEAVTQAVEGEGPLDPGRLPVPRERTTVGLTEGVHGTVLGRVLLWAHEDVSPPVIDLMEYGESLVREREDVGVLVLLLRDLHLLRSRRMCRHLSLPISEARRPV